MKYQRVAVYGDSILKGVVLPDGGARYHTLQPSVTGAFGEAFGLDILNRSKFGYTARDGLALIKDDLADGLTADAALIAYGGNDCNRDWSAVIRQPEGEHAPVVSLDEYEALLRQMIDLLRARGIDPVCVTLPPIHAEKFADFFTKGDAQAKARLTRYLGDVQAIYRCQELYAQTLSRVAQETGCRLLHIREAFLNRSDYDALFCRDGMHLNERGHAVMRQAYAEIVKTLD